MNNEFKPNIQQGFTLVEVLVATGLIVLLAAMLLPALGMARESARYTAWSAMSNSMKADPRMALYYDFQAQTDDELNANGETIVINKSQGDPMGLVASEESMRGADDPSMRYGVLRESHPDDDEKGELPYFETNAGRFRASNALRMTGESLTAMGDDPDVDFGSGASNKYAEDWSLNKEGGYIEPEFWAGIVEQGEFQVGIWVRAEDTLGGLTLVNWGDKNGVSYDADEAGNWLLWATGAPGNGNALDDSNRALFFKKTGPGGTNWRLSPDDQDNKIVIQDNQWHFLVLRLKKPYNTIATGLNDDSEVPELDDVELSVDGSPFRYQSDFWGPGNSEDVNRRIDREVERFIIGAAWYDDDNDTDYWNKSRFLRGYIDEFMVWQEPTTEEEIQKIYRSGAPATHAPALFDSGSDWKAKIRPDGKYAGNPTSSTN